MNVTINNGFGTKNLNNNQHSWTNVRSDTYYTIETNYKSKDDIYIYDKHINTCPICFNIIWINNEKIICDGCKKEACKTCMEQIYNNSLNNNQDYKCPFCRFVIKRFYRNVNRPSMYYGNRIVPFDMIEDIPVYHRYLGHRYRYIIRSLYLICFILIIIFIVLTSINKN